MSQKYVYVVQKDYDYQDQTDAFPLHAFSNSNFDEAKKYVNNATTKYPKFSYQI